MVCDLLRPDDPRWPAALTRLQHDVYHTPEYVRFSAAHDGGEPAAFYAVEGEHELLAPVIMRPLPKTLNAPEEWRDAVSPYGYASPLLSAEVRPAAAAELFLSLKKFGAANDIITAFFRLHPLLPVPIEALASQGMVVRHGQSVYVDLGSSPDERRRQMRQGHAYEIRRLERAGYRATLDDWSSYAEFVRVYLATMERVSADAYYLLSSDYFEDLRAFLGDALHLCSVVSPSGALAAAGLFSVRNGIVQYLFSGTAEPFLKQAPTKLMLYSVIEWAGARGERVLHLGGGVGAGEDSLFRFKAGFSRSRADFSTWRLVFDTTRYHQLQERRSRGFGTRTHRLDGFFPEYRMCIPTPQSLQDLSASGLG